jgi:hypothetical protein
MAEDNNQKTLSETANQAAQPKFQPTPQQASVDAELAAIRKAKEHQRGGSYDMKGMG